jgi:hypothetical protein
VIQKSWGKVKLAVGYALAAVGFLWMLIGIGPLGWPGIPLFGAGLLLILSQRRDARRWFINAARQDPRFFGAMRRWLRRRQAKRGPPSSSAGRSRP